MKVKSEYIGNGVSIDVSEEHTFGTDAVLLADFANIRKNDKACDFGTGCGIIPFIWLRDSLNDKGVCAVEIQEEACLLARNSAEKNGMSDKIKIYEHDVCDIRSLFEHASFDLVTMNPPYFAENSGKESPNESVRIARHEIKCDIFRAAKSAAYALKHSGRFCVCHRPERLCDVFEAMRKNGIEPKRLCEVFYKKDSSPWLILAEGRKGGKTGLKIEAPLIMYDENGCAGEEFRHIYRGFETEEK